MKLSIRKGGGVPYARKEDYEWEGTKYEADIKNGDIVTILDGGENETGQFGEQTYFKIETRNGVKKMPFNQASINVLVEEFGDESDVWMTREVKVLTKKDTIAGKKVIIAYFVTPNWELDDYGDLVKGTAPAPADVAPSADKATEPPLPPV